MPRTKASTPPASRPVLGKRSRTKGQVFERKVAAMLRDRFPEHETEIRRSFQSRAAEESDVTGLPGFWIECQTSAAVTPVAKLEQAERDRASAVEKDSSRASMIPIAVTHRRGARTMQVTLRLADLLKLSVLGLPKNFTPIEHLAPVTIEFEPFIAIARRHVSDVLSAKTIETPSIGLGERLIAAVAEAMLETSGGEHAQELVEQVARVEESFPAPELTPADEVFLAPELTPTEAAPAKRSRSEKRMKRPKTFQILEEKGVQAIEVPFLPIPEPEPTTAPTPDPEPQPPPARPVRTIRKVKA